MGTARGVAATRGERDRHGVIRNSGPCRRSASREAANDLDQLVRQKSGHSPFDGMGHDELSQMRPCGARTHVTVGSPTTPFILCQYGFYEFRTPALCCKINPARKHELPSNQPRDGYVQARRHLELLEVKELQRLMQLALEAACFARGFGERLVAAYHGLAAECAFELWWRDQGWAWVTANPSGARADTPQYDCPHLAYQSLRTGSCVRCPG